MGIWGAGIYSNDTAQDVKDFCSEVFPFVSVEEGNRIALDTFKDILSLGEEHEDYASFWYALADWQWKHGVLSEQFRLSTIDLLRKNTGIAHWKESGTRDTVKKRLNAMEKLRCQLESPMPTIRVPRGKLSVPKHKYGDIVVFRTCTKEQDPDEFFWYIISLGEHYLFQDPILANGMKFLDPPISVHDKYLAIVCVGSERVLHSQYLSDVFDEYSVYAFYDYCSDIKPTVDTLTKCGFIPCMDYSLKDFNRHIHERIGWIYQFSSDNILKTRSAVNETEKYFCPEEATRFNQLLQQKDYFRDIDSGVYDLSALFHSFWETKIRAQLHGIEYDNLLFLEAKNPALLSPLEADEAYQRWRARL